MSTGLNTSAYNRRGHFTSTDQKALVCTAEVSTNFSLVVICFQLQRYSSSPCESVSVYVCCMCVHIKIKVCVAMWQCKKKKRFTAEVVSPKHLIQPAWYNFRLFECIVSAHLCSKNNLSPINWILSITLFTRKKHSTEFTFWIIAQSMK